MTSDAASSRLAAPGAHSESIIHVKREPAEASREHRPRVACLVQARMGSTRLPGKVLADVVGRPMLERQIERLRAARMVDRLAVVTSVLDRDAVVADLARELGLEVFRGSEHDVLDRYHQAALALGCPVLVRVTADCPLLDPDVLDKVVTAFLSGTWDYASNTLQRTYPVGLDVEVFRQEGLAIAHNEASDPYEREHVTPYFYRNPQRFRLLSVTDPDDRSSLRWTVDYPEDLAFVRRVYEHLHHPGEVFRTAEILSLLAERPDLVAVSPSQVR